MEDILRRSVNLMNLDLDREVTAVNRPSRPVDGDPGPVAVGWPYAVFK